MKIDYFSIVGLAVAVTMAGAATNSPASAATPPAAMFPTDPMPPLPAPPAPVVVAKIDKSQQRMRVFVRGKRLHVWKVSTARRGYATPSGQWKPFRMHKMWRSRKYNNSPMPYSLFYSGGFAVHGTYDLKRLGRPASHGCVRLHPAHAKKLYQLVARYGLGNTRIVVTQ